MKPIPAYLEALARFCPLLTREQLGRLSGLYGDALTRFIDAAKAKGLVDTSIHLVRPREATEPIAVIRPDEIPPRAEAVAYAAKRKLSETHPSPTVVLQATARLAALCGGEPRVIPSSHVSHEIAVSSVFIRKWEANAAFEWVLVSQTGPRGARVDAVAGDVLVEIIGAYSGSAVAKKIAVGAGRTLELW